MKDNANYTNILLEEMNGKFDLMLELLGIMDRRMDTFATKEYVDALTRKQDVANATIKDSLVKIKNHDSRLTELEQHRA